MELNLCWWNIGISPPVKGVKKDKAEAIRLAKHYIKKNVSRKKHWIFWVSVKYQKMRL